MQSPTYAEAPANYLANDCQNDFDDGATDAFDMDGVDVFVDKTSAKAGSQFVRFNDGFRDEYSWSSDFQLTSFAAGAESEVPAWFQRGKSATNSIEFVLDNPTTGVEIGIFDVDSGEVVEITAMSATSGGSLVPLTLSSDGEMLATGGTSRRLLSKSLCGRAASCE